MFENMREICKKISVATFIVVFCSIMPVGCSALPTYNLANNGDPAEVVTRFLDAVISGDNSDIGDWIYNYSWQSNEDNSPFGGSVVSESDLALLSLVRNSRDYELIGSSEYSKDRCRAWVTVNYTSFDIGKFSEKLNEDVLEEITMRRNEGELFDSPDDTVEIIERHKSQLLKNPRVFYTTRKYTVELVGDKGCWKILLSDKFYNALSGYSF